MQDALPLPYHPQDFAAQIYAVVTAIPAGRVLSYGEIARLLPGGRVDRTAFGRRYAADETTAEENV